MVNFSLKIMLLVAVIILFGCTSAARYRAIKKEREQAGILSAEAEESSKNIKPDHSVGETTDLDKSAEQWIGTPYYYGGNTRQGVDCSGFTSQAMLNVYHKKIPRTAREQYLTGRKVPESRMKKGDLVFFRGVRGGGIDHVGIFLGNGKFAHASESRGVTISDLSETYYSKRYVGACRF